MRIGVVGVCICAIASGGCIVEAKDRCIQRPGSHFDAGVAYHLSKNGIPFRIAGEGGVCVAEEVSLEFESAMRQVEKYFWEVAYHLNNDCEERAFVDWATRENLRFDVGDVVDLNRKPAGRMFHLRSYTYEEVVSNRRKLNEAPQGVVCAIENMTANNAFERTAEHRGPRLVAALASWPAAQLGR
jgi:hypothetical protein